MGTFLLCNRCGDLSQCDCEDTRQKMRMLAHSPEAAIAIKWCPACDNHYAMCHCATKSFVIMLGGKVVPSKGIETLRGESVEVDLTRP